MDRQASYVQQERPTMSGNKDGNKLNGFNFVILLSFINGVPYGLEFLLATGATTGYVLLFGLILAFVLIFPFTLILSEMASIVPTNHGVVGYVYRGFYSASPRIADFVGFINALNLLLVYCVRLGITPLIFERYFETYIEHPFTAWQSYLVMLAVIVVGFVLGIFNVKYTANALSVLIVLCMLPLFIGFFMVMPDMSLENTILGTCDQPGGLDLSEFIVAFVNIRGYLIFCNLMGDVQHSVVTRLPYIFFIIICVSQVLYFVPFMAVSTLYPSCSDWREGFIGIAYGEIWRPLYYMVEISAILSDFIIYVITVTLTGRLIWAMSQKYLLINRYTGGIVDDFVEYHAIDDKYRKSLAPGARARNDGDDEQAPTYGRYTSEVYTAYLDSDDDDMYGAGESYVREQDQQPGHVGHHDQDGYYRIRIRILPKCINKVWRRTGAPIWGILLQALISIVICAISINWSYHVWTEFLVFQYLFVFLMVTISFLLLKHYEPDMEREVSVPGQKCGAYTVALIVISSIMIIGLFLVREQWDQFLIAIAFNFVFVGYYFLWRVCGCCCRRLRHPAIAAPDDFDESVALL